MLERPGQIRHGDRESTGNFGRLRHHRHPCRLRMTVEFIKTPSPASHIGAVPVEQHEVMSSP